MEEERIRMEGEKQGEEAIREGKARQAAREGDGRMRVGGRE